MAKQLNQLPIEERIRLVEDLWDSIARDQASLPLTSEQALELDRRLNLFEFDKKTGRLALQAIADIRNRL